MGKADATLKAIFAEPTRANISWKDIEALLKNLGGEVSKGRGSRVRVVLNDVVAIFHKPHPQKEAHRPLVRSVRRFLEGAGVTP